MYAASGSYHCGSQYRHSNCIQRAAYLQVLCRTIPDVYSLPERVVAIVKCAAGLVELVGKDELLFLAIPRFPFLDAIGRIRIDETGAYVL